ncbi:MAG: choice-of-anchor D domain-containing protein, partial [Deltaproteobacteria bacterium]|nr:choice-of-anchor D domain-containing protein [Deltaproteobacteria bacterium]
MIPPPDAPEIDAPPPRPAVLTMTPTTNDFGSVVINTTSGAASFTVTNTGEATSGSITPVVTGAAAADFTPTNGCTTLAGGGTCVVTVTFRPSSAGVKNANLVVSGSPGGSAMATLIGTGQTPGTLTITPSSLAFGNQVVGTPTASQTFTVMNTGTVATTALTVTKAGTDPADFVKGADTCNGATLAGGASCTVAVTFNPTSAGGKAASFVISAATGGSVNGSVTGTGLNPARLVVTPGFQDFGSITTGTSSGNISFTVTNTGDIATSAITDSFTGTNGGEFSRLSTTCTTLAPNASCTIVVRFTPLTVGAKSANLTVVATTGGTANAALIGQAVAPGNLAISPTPFAFADTTVGQISTTQVFTVTNTGGSATGALGTALGGTDPSQFTVVAGSNGCQGVVLAPAGSCTIVLSFSPTTGGAKTATLAVNHTGGSTTAAISGNAIAPAQFTLTPASRDFGSVVTTTTSAPQPFTLQNIGGQTSGAPSFAINGANASEFSVNVTGCAGTLAPNASCTVQVTFSPATAGAKSATLDVTGTGGPVSSALSGNGITNAALTVNPSIINFPLTLIGTSAGVESFTVTNGGSVNTGNLTVMIIGAAAGDYTQTNDCTDGGGPGVDFLTPGAQCVVTVTFTPTAPGPRSATVQISGAPGGTVGTAVNGTALPKLEILAPVPVTYPINNYTFPNSIVDPNADPALRRVVDITLRNNSAAAVDITETPSFGTGLNGPDFAVVTDGCGTNLAAGATCTYRVAYTPESVGTHMGSVIFTSSVAGTFATARQNLTGTANANTLSISDLDATPTAHDFGSRAVGSSSASRMFRVTNLSNEPTGVLAVDLTGAGFQIEMNNCSGLVLAGNASCDIFVVFTPTTQTSQMGTLTVRTSQGSPVLGGTVVATLSGTGTAPVALAAPTALNWGPLFAGDTNVANTDEVVVITNSNDIQTTLTFTLTDDSLPATQFSLVAAATNPCGATLAAGASCNQGIRLTPALPVGTRTGNLLVTSSVGNNTSNVSLIGSVVSTLSLVTAPTAFTDQLVNTSASQTLTVRNDSLQTVTGFTITAGAAPYFILNNTCISLAPGATCTFDLQFSPTNAPASFPRTLLIEGGSTGSASASVTGNSITAANVTVTPAARAFGSELVGQNGATQSFTFTNLGQQTSGVMAVALDSTTNFSIQSNTCTTTLAFNASCVVTVRFNPTVAGSPTASLTGTATPGGAPSAALSGVAIPAG